MTEVNPDNEWVRRAVLQRLQSVQRSGMQQLPIASSLDFSPLFGDVPTPDNVARPTANVVTEAATAPKPVVTQRAASPSADRGQSATLDILRDEVAACTLCDELARFRKQTVFGVGNPKARLCFLGEAPGADEDRQGEPFVGRAGQLLTDIIQKGMKISRDDIYILNVIKCRPPGNRNPTEDEVTNCRPFFERQLELIKPEFICCLGAVAAQNLLDRKDSVGRMRGRFHDWRGIKVLVTYHPAYLLRNESAKKDVWADVQLLMAEMGM